MSLGKRIIKVTIQPDVNDPNANIILDDSLDIEVKIHKDVMSYQNRAEIEVVGLSTSLRESLLSRFTAYQLARINAGFTAQKVYYRVRIDAGYQSTGSANQILATVFIGELALVEPTSAPPNIGIKLTCFTHQIDKTLWTTTNSLPGKTTFAEVVNWLAAQFQAATPTGVFNVEIDTDFANFPVSNPGSTFTNLGAACSTLMSYHWPYIYAYIDDDTLYVRDRTKVDNSPLVDINEFVGPPPSWTDAGVKGSTLFNESLQIMSNIRVNSKMNPSLSDSNFIIGKLDLHLTSRRVPFYTTFEGYITDQSTN